MAISIPITDSSLDDQSKKALRKVKDDNSFAQIGQALRQERDKRKLRIVELTELTGITPSNIQLLEAGELQESQCPTIVKGYIKCYAKALDIPLQELLDTFQQAVEARQQTDETNESVTLPYQKYLKLAPVGIVFLVILLVFLVLPVQSNVLAERIDLSYSAAQLLNDNSRLQILARRDALIEITDTEGNILKAGPVSADEEFVVEGQPPFQVMLQDGVVDINYLTQSIHLTGKSGDNIALFGE